MEIEKEIRELKRRLDLAETRLSQMEGEFVSGQLRDIQLYMHARFEDVDKRFDDVDRRFDEVDRRFEGVEGKLDALDVKFDTLDTKVDALPRVLAEMIGRKS